MDQISQKHRGKHSQQNVSVLNPTEYKKNYKPQSKTLSVSQSRIEPLYCLDFSVGLFSPYWWDFLTGHLKWILNPLGFFSFIS